MGLTAGDEVVVPAATFVATLEAVTQAGGVPVVVDISDEDYCLDPEAAEAAIGPRTHSLMPVHLYGQMADMHALRRTARHTRVAIIEDACQAHGAERDGLRAGTVGAAGAFASTRGRTSAQRATRGRWSPATLKVASRVRALREHGQTAKYVHAYRGWTARLDTIQALVLSNKLALLDEWNDQRRAAASFYDDALRGTGDLRLPPVPEGSLPVWHLYVVRTGDPEALAGFLRERGIGTGRHYPEPVLFRPRHTRASATVRVTSPSQRGRRPRVPVAAHVSRHHPDAAR